jgi:hypothetical protein
VGSYCSVETIMPHAVLVEAVAHVLVPVLPSKDSNLDSQVQSLESYR